MKKRWILILLLVCCIFAIPVTTRADFGNFSGDSDYGGSSDWSSGNSYSSYDDDRDYGSSSGASGDDSLGFVVTLIIFIAITVIGGGSKERGKKKRGGKKSKNAEKSKTDRSKTKLTSIAEYTKLDPNFKAQELTEKAANLYVQMQNDWTAKDIEPLRPYFSDALFTQMERSLKEIVKRGETNMVERIAVLEVTPLGFRQSAGEDIITLCLRTRIVDYTVNDSTKEVVSGSRNREKFMTYEWDILRPSGMITGEDTGTTKRISCPSCGAPLDVNASARCPYCGSVIQQQAKDWVIGAIRGIRQETR